MRVIALVSLAFALVASSLPLSSRATENQSVGNFGTTSSEIGNAVGSLPASGETKPGSGTASGLGSGTLSGRSDNIVNSVGGPTIGSSGDPAAPVRNPAESAVGTTLAPTNPATHGTPVRERTTGSGFDAGTVANEITGQTNGAGKVTQITPSGAQGVVQGVPGGTAANPLTGSSLGIPAGSGVA